MASLAGAKSAERWVWGVGTSVGKSLARGELRLGRAASEGVSLGEHHVARTGCTHALGSVASYFIDRRCRSPARVRIPDVDLHLALDGAPAAHRIRGLRGPAQRDPGESVLFADPVYLHSRCVGRQGSRIVRAVGRRLVRVVVARAFCSLVSGRHGEQGDCRHGAAAGVALRPHVCRRLVPHGLVGAKKILRRACCHLAPACLVGLAQPPARRNGGLRAPCQPVGIPFDAMSGPGDLPEVVILAAPAGARLWVAGGAEPGRSLVAGVAGVDVADGHGGGVGPEAGRRISRREFFPHSGAQFELRATGQPDYR